MNRYGAQAQRHWLRAFPDRVRQLADPEGFFTQLGEDVAQAIEQMARELAGRDQLTGRGIPPEQIRYAQSATIKQKDQLQRDARDGKIAVLIGSRSKLGTGVNIQRRVVAVIQVDPTWKLTPITQSPGRGQRQGNPNPAIHHIFLVTEGSYDPFLWQKVDTNARFTQQMLDPHDTTRTLELVDPDSDSGRIEPAVMFAVGAGKPDLDQHRTRLRHLQAELDILDHPAEASQPPDGASREQAVAATACPAARQAATPSLTRTAAASRPAPGVFLRSAASSPAGRRRAAPPRLPRQPGPRLGEDLTRGRHR